MRLGDKFIVYGQAGEFELGSETGKPGAKGTIDLHARQAQSHVDAGVSACDVDFCAALLGQYADEQMA